MTNVTIPHEVAEAIELMRREGETNYGIICRANVALITEPDVTLHRWAFEEEGGTVDELMRALVNGYEVEKTPEEKLREYYEWMLERTYPGSVYAYKTSAIRDTLKTLGITIEGINA